MADEVARTCDQDEVTVLPGREHALKGHHGVGDELVDLIWVNELKGIYRDGACESFRASLANEFKMSS